MKRVLKKHWTIIVFAIILIVVMIIATTYPNISLRDVIPQWVSISIICYILGMAHTSNNK